MGTVLDALHVYNGVSRYQNTFIFPFLDVAWYVPLEFTAAGAVVGYVRPELDEEFHRPEYGLPGKAVLWGLVLLGLAWWGSGALTRGGISGSAIASVLTLLAIGTWAILDLTREGAMAAALTAAIGVVVESLIVWTGTYRYLHPDLFVVPQWLPCLYIAACVAIGNIGRYMKYSWRAAPPTTASGSPGGPTPEPADAPRKAA